MDILSKGVGDVYFVCNSKYNAWLTTWMNNNFTPLENDEFGNDALDYDRGFFDFQRV